MTTKIQPKFHIGDYIRWNNSSKMDKFHGEIYAIKEYSDNGSCYLIQTLYGPIPVQFTMQDEWEKVLFYIENSVDEYHSKIKGYFNTLNDAKEGLKECSDWYRPNGTGTIYMKGFGLNSKCQEVYHNY
jgi:hypothetical protein